MQHMTQPTDTEMLDWLEAMVNKPGGVLHDGSEGGRSSLGLRPGNLNRTLREDIARAMKESS